VRKISRNDFDCQKSLQEMAMANPAEVRAAGDEDEGGD